MFSKLTGKRKGEIGLVVPAFMATADTSENGKRVIKILADEIKKLNERYVLYYNRQPKKVSYIRGGLLLEEIRYWHYKNPKLQVYLLRCIYIYNYVYLKGCQCYFNI